MADARPCYGRKRPRTVNVIVSRYAEVMRLLTATLPFSRQEIIWLRSFAPRVLAFVERPDRAQAMPSAIYQHPAHFGHELLNHTSAGYNGVMRSKLMALSPVQRLALQDLLERSAWCLKPDLEARVWEDNEYGDDVPAHGRLPMVRDLSFMPRFRVLRFHKMRRAFGACPCCRKKIKPAKQRVWYKWQAYHPWCMIGIWRHNPHVLVKLTEALSRQRPGYWTSRIDALREAGFLDVPNA